MNHRFPARQLACAAAVVAAIAAISAPALAGTTARPAGHAPAVTPVITGVTFSSGAKEGSPTPLVTIKGTGFGNLPTPRPAGNPQDYVASGCDGVVPGYDGLDFGTSLWFNNGLFQAGSATPGGGGNCIGLVIWKYSGTRIQFGFGVVYGPPLQLDNGDHYIVNVRGVRKSGTVSISP